jgi:hypothetical protein
MANVPVIPRIEQLKLQVHMIARVAQLRCQMMVNAAAEKDGQRSVIKHVARYPFKYYARLIGLRGGDLNGGQNYPAE